MGQIDEEVYQGFAHLADRIGSLDGIPPSREPFKIKSLLDIKPLEKPDLNVQLLKQKDQAEVERWMHEPMPEIRVKLLSWCDSALARDLDPLPKNRIIF